MWRWIAVLLFFATPCLSQEVLEEHQLRVRNSFDRPIEKIQVGPAVFEALQVGTTTDYATLSSGRWQITGTLLGKGNIYLDGTLILPVTEPQPWTLTLNEDRSFSVLSDLPPPAFNEEVIRNPGATSLRIRLRFQNWFTDRVAGLRIADINYRDIPAGGTTGYVWIPSGTLDVGVDIEGLGPATIEDQIYIPAEAHRRYTLRLDERGTLVLIQEP